MKTHKMFLQIAASGLALLVHTRADAVSITLINNETPAYYNGSIGTLLNETSSAFPDSIDPDLDFAQAPDLSAAQTVLGDWLSPTPTLPHQFWTPIPVQIPRQWPVGSESAIVYEIVVPPNGYTNVVMNFGTDNGIFVWLDGQYLGGYLRWGGAVLGEHQFTVTNLLAGTHYLQVLREDHGLVDDYRVEVTAEADSPSVVSSIHTAVEISWQSEAGGLYQIQRATQLVPPDWNNFGLPITGDGSEMSVFDRTRDLQQKFYQVLKIR